MITHFTILGERCSGTNFLQQAISHNFDIQVSWKYGWKHFFGFSDYSDSDDILCIGIVRKADNWINSLYRKPYHLNNSMRSDSVRFLTEEAWSYHDSSSGTPTGEEIMEDRNIYFPDERYVNIFELRETKARFLVEDMPFKVKNYILIKYEDLRDRYQDILEDIRIRFHLQRKSSGEYQKIPMMGGSSFGVGTGKIDPEKIISGLDLTREADLGYSYLT